MKSRWREAISRSVSRVRGWLAQEASEQDVDRRSGSRRGGGEGNGDRAPNGQSGNNGRWRG